MFFFSSFFEKEIINEIQKLYDYVTEHLPSYARPLFLRVKSNGEENDKTSTLKFQKFKYVKEGFDPSTIKDDQLYFYDRTQGVETYVVLNDQIYQQICDNHFQL